MALLLVLLTIFLILALPTFYFYYFYLLDSQWMMARGIQYLHMTDDLNITDYKHNLIALWAKCIVNAIGWTKFQDLYMVDLLPDYTRITAKWPFYYMWLPSMLKNSATTIKRLDLMDMHMLRLFRLCHSEHNYEHLQIVVVGAGFDTKFAKYLHVTDRPKHLHFIEIDLPKTIDFKKKLCRRLLQRNTARNIPLPTFISADLLKSTMKQLLSKENGFDDKMPTIFIFEAILCYLKVREEPHIVNTIMQDISEICEKLPDSFVIMFDGVPSIADTATVEDAEQYFSSLGFTADYLDLTPVPSHKVCSVSAALSRIPKLIDSTNAVPNAETRTQK